MGLIHQPELVFMDEPTTGLDPQSRANLWDHIRNLRDNFGVTIFLTTHYMDEADALSDRLLIIDHGEIVGQGTPTQLKGKISGETITLTLRDLSDATIVADLTKQISTEKPRINGNNVQIQVDDGAAQLPDFIRQMSKNLVEPIGIEISRPTLDDVFLKLTGRTLRD